jgi:hypothetical protein
MEVMAGRRREMRERRKMQVRSCPTPYHIASISVSSYMDACHEDYPS